MKKYIQYPRWEGPENTRKRTPLNLPITLFDIGDDEVHQNPDVDYE